jgi:hypothetical protein
MSGRGLVVRLVAGPGRGAGGWDAPAGLVLGLGRGEDLDAVRGGELGEAGRIGRDGLG